MTPAIACALACAPSFGEVAPPLSAARAHAAVQEFESCLQLIDAHLRDYNNVAEYPLYVKALLR